MDLKIVREEMLNYGAKVGLKVEEETSEKLVVHSELTAKQHFSCTVYLRVVVFASGTIHVFLTFNEMEKTYDNLFLINKFNVENPWFRAYIANINGKDYLELHYTSFSIESEGEATETVGYLLTELLEDNTLKYLKPIVNGSNYLSYNDK